jgi:hypothetical protein
MAFEFRLLSIGPRIEKRGGRLIARSPWRVRIATLGCYAKTLVVDPERRIATVSHRWFWFFTSKSKIKFDHIEAIAYSYQDWAIGSFFSWAHDSTDLFRVALKLHGDDVVSVFSFFGDGTVTNHGPWPDWVYWEEYLTDLSGTQERESRAFVELLSRMIGVPVVAGA